MHTTLIASLTAALFGLSTFLTPLMPAENTIATPEMLAAHAAMTSN